MSGEWTAALRVSALFYSLLTIHYSLKKKANEVRLFRELAERTGLEPATSAVTGQHSNQLNYRSYYLQFGGC